GVSRIGFSEGDLGGRGWLMQQMRDSGLAVRVDPAGNIFGKRAGQESLPTTLFGSHIDSVPGGGNFDGDVGSLDALEVMRALNDGKVATRHPLEMDLDEHGFANHAGTTPMNRRQNALIAASKAALAVREEVRAEPGRQVGTVGYVRVDPGARNVIPGRVEFPVELRDPDGSKLVRIWARIEKRFQQISLEENVTVDCTGMGTASAALTDPA